MTIGEARYVWEHRDEYSAATVAMALEVLTYAKEI